jgi:hypothetical protein
MRNWRNSDYLLDGTERQQAAYRALRYVGIEWILADFDPILVGTIPLNIDIESSDLDILLEIPDEFQYAQMLFPHFAEYQNFRYRRKTIRGETAWITNFLAHGFEFELFAQCKPTTQQIAYRHMLVEHRLLEIGGETAREAIRALKQGGLKTEPAFAQYFDFQNDDPYEALLKASELDYEVLRELFSEKG